MTNEGTIVEGFC